jgi:hypothetical protein
MVKMRRRVTLVVQLVRRGSFSTTIHIVASPSAPTVSLLPWTTTPTGVMPGGSSAVGVFGAYALLRMAEIMEMW